MKQLKRELADKSLEANYNLWQAVLAVNSLMATIFIALVSFSNMSPVGITLSLVGFMTSTYACIDILLAFKNTRNMYRTLSKIIYSEKIPDQDEENHNLSEAHSVFDNNNRIELRSLYISVIAWMLLALIMTDKFLSPYSFLPQIIGNLFN